MSLTPTRSLVAVPCAVAVACGPALIFAQTPSQPVATPGLELPHRRFTLDNGLVVIFHEDHTVPVVAVNLSYKVGSRDERKGRTGFAHLFEHLMFMGTARVGRGAFDGLMEAEGGWNNAWTSTDRTEYYAFGPSRILPLFLWLEADRLSELGRHIDQTKLDLQREVVRNERRQTSEDTPYGQVELLLPGLLYAKGHPYHHPVIGSHADLQAASVLDVQQFFTSYYVPESVSLVVAGDFDSVVTESEIRRLFGALPRGAAATNLRPVGPAPSTAAIPTPRTVEDRVDQPRVYFAWQTPAYFAPDDAELSLLSDVLTDGRASRLYQSMVYERQLAQDVVSSQESASLGSQFVIYATAREGVALEALEAGLDAELSRALQSPPTAAEMEAARNGAVTDFVSGLQSVLSRAAQLNAYQSELGEPDALRRDLSRLTNATADGVVEAARRWLSPERRAVLRIVPTKAPE